MDANKSASLMRDSLVQPSPLSGEGWGGVKPRPGYLSPNPSPPAERGMKFKLGHH